MKYTGGCWTGLGVLDSIYLLFFSDFDGVIVGGKVGEKFLLMISLAILLLCGIYVLVMAFREDKRRKSES